MYGIRRVHAELRLGHGISISHGTVMPLMQRAGFEGPPGNRRRRPRHDTPTAADLVDRNFAGTAPDKLWVTDITEHPVREGKVYCAVVLDAYSRRVVGWFVDSTRTAARLGVFTPGAQGAPSGQGDHMGPLPRRGSVGRAAGYRRPAEAGAVCGALRLSRSSRRCTTCRPGRGARPARSRTGCGVRCSRRC